MKKVLILGATGLIGQEMLKEMMDKAEYIVAGVTRSEQKREAIEHFGAKAYVGDALSHDDIDAIVADFQPDVIINQLTDLKSFDLDGNTKIRVVGSKIIGDVASKYNVKRVVSQSISWMNDAGNGLVIEDEALDTQATGDRQVILDGVIALEEETKRNTDFVILRYGNLYGPGTWYDTDGFYYTQYKNGSAVVTPGIHSFLHVTDAAKTAVQALEWESGTYFVVDNEPTSSIEFGEYYAALIQAPTPQKVDAAYWERGQSNKKFVEVGGTLHHKSWRDGLQYLKKQDKK